MQLTRFPAPDAARDVRFSRTDDSILVEERFESAPPPNETGFRLSRYTLDGTVVDTLVDLELTPKQQHLSIPFSYLELDSGHIATIEADTMWLRDSSGDPIRQLTSPIGECSVIDQWPDGQIMISCPDPKAEPGCWTRGLWLVPVDGSMPELLAMPSSRGACYERYDDAEVLGAAILIKGSAGEGQCEGFIELIDGTSTQIWQPDDEQLCNAQLIGVRDGAWLVRGRWPPRRVRQPIQRTRRALRTQPRWHEPCPHPDRLTVRLEHHRRTRECSRHRVMRLGSAAPHHANSSASNSSTRLERGST